MSASIRLTDHAIRAALTPAAEVRAPAGLAVGIRAAIETIPQRRPLIPWLVPSPRARLVLRLVVVGLLVLGAAVALILAGSRRPTPSVPPAVTTYHGGPERAGVMPGPGPSGGPRLEWQHQVTGPFGPWSPVVVDGVVYVGDEGGAVTALAEATGEQRWQVNVGAAVNSGLSIAGRILVVGDDDGVVHGLDIASGVERWAFLAGQAVHSAAAVVGNVAYLGGIDGRLHALDVATGAPLWPPVTTPGPISRAIAVAGGVIYVGSGGASASDRGSVGAYDAATGAARWTVALAPGNTTSVTVADGLVFVGDGLDSPTATIRALQAFDAVTGRSAWSEPFVTPSGKVLLVGAVGAGLVFATATDGNLYALDEATGTLRWQLPIGSNLTPNAGLVGGTLYVTSDDRRIHAIDVSSASELWSFGVTGVPTAPAVVNGRIIVGTNLGLVVSVTGTNARTPGSSSGP